uniref:Ras-GEF domain-containing protein n=1 Tax=Parascaris equorum TaxID=6256 RepID=A0A914RM98_PAREQ
MNFTDRFNSVCLWCQREILSCEKPSKRADVSAHFIKVAKRLSELNNLHSAFAIVSALQSHPIHRLSKTWNFLTKDLSRKLVSRHDRSVFEKTARLFDSERNWERFNLWFDDITHVECIQKYLCSFQFHEELLKFAEDDLYRLSLKREPDLDASTSHAGASSHSHSLTPQLNHDRVAPKAVLGHRKTQSLGTQAMIGFLYLVFPSSFDFYETKAQGREDLRALKYLARSKHLNCLVDTVDMTRSVDSMIDSSKHNLLDGSSLSHDFECLLNINNDD